MAQLGGPGNQPENEFEKALKNFAEVLPAQTVHDVVATYKSNKVAYKNHGAAVADSFIEVTHALAKSFESVIKSIRPEGADHPTSSELLALIKDDLHSIASKVANEFTASPSYTPPHIVLHEALQQNEPLHAAFNALAQRLDYIGAVMGKSNDDFKKQFDEGKRSALLESLATAMIRGKDDFVSAFRAEIARSNLLRA